MARRSLTPRHMAVRVRMARRKTVASVLALLLRPAAQLRGADQGGFRSAIRIRIAMWRAPADQHPERCRRAGGMSRHQKSEMTRALPEAADDGILSVPQAAIC